MPKKITVPDTDFWNEEEERFCTVKGTTIKIEHSLWSISRWEELYKKPFLHTNMNRKELLNYIRFMTISPNLDYEFYDNLPPETIKEIQDYINDPMTATWFSERKSAYQKPTKKEIITSELVYYWMIKCGIPFEAEKWHFNRLMTLIRVYNVQESAGDKKNKMSREDIYRQNRELNAMRRAQHSSGEK